MIDDSVRTTFTVGDSNPGDTTITHNTTGIAAGLVCKKLRVYSSPWVQRLDVQRRKRSCLNEYTYLIGTDPVTLAFSDLMQALEIQQNHPVLVKAIQQLEEFSCRSRDRVDVCYSDPARALKILKNYQVLVEATQQLKKMLPKSRDARIIASKILSRLSIEEIVLLSCTTSCTATISREDRSEYLVDAEEEEVFCRKFTYFVSGSWNRRDVLDSWEKFHKVCQFQACRPYRVDVAYLQKLIGSIHEEETAIRGSFGSVIQWDLVHMRVIVDEAVEGELV